jgi:hypothetical protein
MDIINSTLQKTLRTLGVIGAKYIIVMPDGTEHSHGDLVLAPPPKSKTRKVNQNGQPRRVRGELSKVVAPFIKDMQVGDVVTVPQQEGITRQELVKSLSSHAIHMWGSGSASTMHNFDTDCAEILRLA